MKRIQTNKINVSFAIDKLSAEYEVFNVKTTDTYFGKGANAAKIVDDFTSEKFVLSVVYERGNSFYVLLRKSDNNRQNLDKAIRKAEDSEKISLEETALGMLPQNILLQLLLNSMGTYEGKVLGFHNVTGHFYIHNNEWKRSKGLQLICLELKVTKDLLLDWSVRTFTSVSLKRQIEFKKKKFGEYPEYVLSKDNMLKRVEKGKDPNAFILRQLRDKKYNIKFIDFSSLEKFDKTKMGVVNLCIEKFNDRFKGLAELEFSYSEDFDGVTIETRMVREMERSFAELAASKNIVLVDAIQDDTSEEEVNLVKEKMAEQFKCKKISILKHPKADAVNIILLHDKESYTGKEDPHNKSYKDCAVQHITVETIETLKQNEGGWRSVLDCVMQEALIKEDIKNQKITLADWNSYGFDEDLIFGISKTDEDNINHYYFMTIQPDGCFELHEQENSLFEQNEIQTCIDIFGMNDVTGLVKKGKDINVVYNTKLRTLPELQVIKERLNNKDNKMRDKVSREEIFPSVTDIKCFSEDEHSLYYLSGIIGAGMQSFIPNAVNVRKVDTYLFSNLFFKDLLQLMAVTFVRNGQLTVMPFPFKYLHEYANSQN